MTCTNGYDTITQADGLILPNAVPVGFNQFVDVDQGAITSSCRVADGTWVAWFQQDPGNTVGDGTLKTVWPANIASSVQIFVGFFADDGSAAVVHELSVQSVCYRWGGTGLYGIDDPCSVLPILGMKFSDNVKSELDGWFTDVRDVRVCTDGANVWVVVLANESVDYPWLYGNGGNDACGNFHPPLANVRAGEAGDAFNHDTSVPGQRFWCHFGAPGQDDRGPGNSFRWQPARVSVWSGDLGGFTLLDTIEAQFSNNSNWGFVSGVEACASPAEPGICHVMWSEGGPFGNEFIDGISYGQRINYSRWDNAGKTLDTDLRLSTGDRASQGSAPADDFVWVWTAEMILRNDHGSPIAIVWPWQGSEVISGIGVEPTWTGPESPGPAQFWDLSSGSDVLLQTMDFALVPTPAEFPGMVAVAEQGAFNAAFAGTAFDPMIDPTIPRRVHYASSLYTDPLLDSGTDVYLICSHFYDDSSGIVMPGGGLVPTRHTAFYRVPVDGSGPFEFLDGNRQVGYSIIDDQGGLVSDFVSETDNVWVPYGTIGYVAQLDRQCLRGWRYWLIADDLDSYGVMDAVQVPTNNMSPLTILSVAGADWLSGGGYHYETPITFTSEIDAGVVRAKICRCCAPCNRTGMHVWEII